jgi:hypothetical protein
MRKMGLLSLSLFLAGYVFLSGFLFLACTPEPQKPITTTSAVDNPSISVQDAISIAQQHSVTSPLNIYESRAGVIVRRGETQGWSAQYISNGKWTVELRANDSNGVITTYHWSVFESNLSAVFLGTF